MSARPFDDLFCVDDTLLVATRHLGVPTYDFDLRTLFPCRAPRPGGSVVARVGAISDYAAWTRALAHHGFLPIQDEAAHRRCSELDAWYPLLSDLTPRSVVYDTPPTADQVARDFAWPVFVKGAIQSNRHAGSSIVAGPAEFTAQMARWRDDPILHWQRVAVREFVALRRVAGGRPQEVPASCEFRTFYWRGQRAAFGRYWHAVPAYDVPADALAKGLLVADEAARRLDVPFLVIDVALTVAGEWLVIEPNDAQESGLAAISPFVLWHTMLERERARK